MSKITNELKMLYEEARVLQDKQFQLIVKFSDTELTLEAFKDLQEELQTTAIKLNVLQKQIGEIAKQIVEEKFLKVLVKGAFKDCNLTDLIKDINDTPDNEDEGGVN